MVDATAGVTGNVSGILSSSFGLVIFVVVAIIIGVVIWVIWNNKQYKYGVDLKVLKEGGFTKYYDTARSINLHGENFWKLKHLKILVSVPPPESISQNIKGGFVGEGYYERNIGVIWSRDTMTRQQFEALSKSLQEKRKQDPTFKADPVDTQYQPITSQERSLQAMQITKAQLRKGKSGWELLRELVGPILMFLVLVLVIIFWNKIAAPVLEVQQSTAQIAAQNTLIQQQNLRFYMMLTGGKGNSTYVVQALPEDQQTFNLASRAGGTT